MSAYLNRVGYNAIAVETAMEASRILRSEVIDILLLDINLPDCDGLEFYSHIRQQFPDIAVIAMSGKASAEQRRRARESEIQTFLVKPFPLSVLKGLLADLAVNDIHPAKVHATGPGFPETVSASEGVQGIRILVYCHDMFGLGNLRRMLSIANFLTETDPAISILMLSGSSMMHAYRLGPRIDYIKMPCLTRDVAGNSRVKFLDIDYQRAVKLRSNLILQGIDQFQPNMILVDKKPFGVSGELEPVFNLLRKKGRLPPCALVLRDILDKPQKTIAIWHDKQYHQIIEQYYERILVIGDRRVFDLPGEYAFPASSREKTIFCGYLDRTMDLDPQPIDAHRGEEKRRIVVTAGGGQDGFHLLSSFLDAAATCRLDFQADVICGPDLAQDQWNILAEQAADLGQVRLLRFTDQLPELIRHSDLVIAMGGHNTVSEILSLGRRAILVPRTHPVMEQWIRASALEQLGLVTMIEPTELTAETLRIQISKAFTTGPVSTPSQPPLDFGGHQRILTEVHRISGVRMTPEYPSAGSGLQTLAMGEGR
jgi:predicted glycosyltransferase